MEDARYPYQIQWHSQLRIRLDIERLRSRQTRGILRLCVFPFCQTTARNVEELWRIRRRWKLVRVSDLRNVILVLRSFWALRRHSGGM